MLFKLYTEYLEKLEKISSRLAITDEVAKLLKDLSAKETEGGIYLLMGRLAPAYTGLEFNLGWKMVLRAVCQLSGLSEKEALADYKKRGDVGEVILSLEKHLFKDKQMTVGEVYEKLLTIARYSGGGSQEQKVGGLTELLSHLDQLSAKFVARMVIGKLRLGFSDKTVLDALSMMTKGDKSARKKLDEVYQITPDVGLLVKRVKEEGLVKTLSHVSVKAGVPVMPALCQRLNHAAEIIEKMGEVAAEQKFDGTRVQIHFKKGEVRTFTRNLEENSYMFPELLNLSKWIDGESAVLDSEAVGIDPKTGKILPFQMTITRKRKHDVKETAKNIPLRFYVFDILEKDGKTLLNEPYFKRREILEKTVKKNETVVVDKNFRTQDPKELHRFHEQCLKDGYEGAVIKKWDGTYLPGRQGWNWVKIKEAEGSTGKLSDTIDCVVMGYYKGRGKRVDFGMGAFLVGIRKGEDILTIAKIGTGLSDEQFRELKKRLDPLKVKEAPKNYRVDKNLVPDVWVDPEVIVEVAADELTKSPNHTAGVALRFPRLVKFRDDKDLSGVTTLKEVATIKVQ